jgi:hypothetical protein
MALKIDFEKFNEAGLKPVLTAFKRAGLPVSEVSGTNRAKRESGFLTKTVTFLMKSGQKLIVKAKAGGGIYQVKLNSKVLPIKAVDNMDKALKEVIRHTKANEEKYKKAKAKRDAKLKDKKIPLPKLKPVNTSVKARITEQEGLIADLTEDNTALTAERDVAAGTVDTKQGALDGINAQITEETDRSEGLQGTIDNLQTELDGLREGM